MAKKSFIPKFLLAFDRNFVQKFIVHTKKPMFFVPIENDELIVETLLQDCNGDPEFTGVVMRMKDWYKSVNKKQIAPEMERYDKNKFLITIDPINEELYILHRQFPACLFWVKQETPVRFIIQDLYDDVENMNEIFNMPFIQEAKDFFRDYGGRLYGGN